MRTYRIEMSVVVHVEAETSEDARIKAGAQAAKGIEEEGWIDDLSLISAPQGGASMSHFIMADEGVRDVPDWPMILIGPFDSFNDADEWARENLSLPNWIIETTHPKEVQA